VAGICKCRMSSDVFRHTSPSLSHVEANEMPMELRRRRLASQYSLNICSNLSDPGRNCAFDERFTKLFDKRPNQIRPLGLRIKTDLSAIGFKQKDIFTSSISTVPPCLLKRPFIDLSLVGSGEEIGEGVCYGRS